MTKAKSVLGEIKVAAQEAPKMYFAPLVGAVRGIQAQYRVLSSKTGAALGHGSDKPVPKG